MKKTSCNQYKDQVLTTLVQRTRNSRVLKIESFLKNRSENALGGYALLPYERNLRNLTTFNLLPFLLCCMCI